MKPRVYIAAKFENRPYVRVIAEQLRNEGFIVTSTWHDRQVATGNKVHQGLIDLQDINNCDLLLLLSENGAQVGGGGRNFEAGYAYAKEKTIAVVGTPEYIFLYQPDVLLFDTLSDFVEGFNGAIVTDGGN